jgi:hypothetical protein
MLGYIWGKKSQPFVLKHIFEPSLIQWKYKPMWKNGIGWYFLSTSYNGLYVNKTLVGINMVN